MGLLLLLPLLLLGGATGREPAVVSYLPEWRYEGVNWDYVARRSTHVLLFSLEMDPASGRVTARDRLPRAELMEEARAACSRHRAKLVVCFGGNGRSGGFSRMARSPRRRALFVAEVRELLEAHALDGVDLNWEYPGYDMRRGSYLPQAEIEADYAALGELAKELRSELPPGAFISCAYYPDGRQELLLRRFGVDAAVDLLHMMSYDQHGEHHSSMPFAQRVAAQGARLFGASASKVTLGVPFYGRHPGGWASYEDIVQGKAPPAVRDNYDTVERIRRKTRLALDHSLAGVMIWEAGQDCRVYPVTHGDTTHVATCPAGINDSLLNAIAEEIGQSGNREDL